MSRTDPQFNLRIPESLRDMVMWAAKQNKRSATAEILDRLERSFREPDAMGISDLDRMDPENDFYTPEPEQRITTKISKEQLTATPSEISLLSEDRVVAAMLRALRVLEDEKAWEAAQPSQGPKPRKRYPKE